MMVPFLRWPWLGVRKNAARERGRVRISAQASVRAPALGLRRRAVRGKTAAGVLVSVIEPNKAA